MSSYKLDIKRVLEAIDTKDRDFFSRLSDEEKKGYSPYVLIRFMSSMQKSANHELALVDVNEFVNKDLRKLSKHPELIHLLFTVSSQGKKTFHTFIKSSSKKKSKLYELLKRRHKDINEVEFSILIKQYDVLSITNLCLDYGMEDREIKQYIEEFNEM